MLRKLAVLIVALACASVARAVDTYACYSGYAEQGGAKVVTNGIESATRVQRSFPGATVTVYDHDTTNLSSLFDTGTGGVKTNPFTAASTSLAFWCALPGMYDIQYSGTGAGITTPFTVSNVGIAFFPLPFPFTLSGNTTELMTVDDITGPAGTALCKDADGNATTIGCPGGGSGNATSIQGVPVTAGVTLTPGTSLNINADGTAFIGQTRFDVDSRDCGIPIDQSDAWATTKACILAHPGARIRFWKTAAAAGSCDYNFSDTLWLFGHSQSLEGRSDGTGNTNLVNLCWTKPGVIGIAATNQMAQGIVVRNLGLFGDEAWSRTNAATFIPGFGYGYPGIAWITGTASASSTTLTVNGTNEAWTSQTDGLTVQVYGGGAQQGTVSIATTAGSSVGTCACTPAMIGETVAIATAGPAGGTLYAKIIAIAGGGGGPTSGNAWFDRNATATVGAATSNLYLDYYGTISSHSSASSATITPVMTTSVTASIVIVGSQADAIALSSNQATIEGNQIINWGRDAIHAQSSRFGGAASQLSDSSRFFNNIMQLNRGSAIYMQGGDANLNQVRGGVVSQNQYWGVDDTGFLGNTYESTNSATNHEDCTILPCPSNGGATGGFKNITGSWKAGVPYASAPSPPIFVTDGTCTNASTTVTTTATGKFKTGQADATTGQIIVLTGCGAAAAPLTTFITGFTSANSITVADAAACGGGCPTPGTVTIQTYPTVTIVSAPFFDPSYVGHSFLLQHGGPDNHALVTTMVIYYSTTKVGLNAAPKNSSVTGLINTAYYGASDYSKELTWGKAWNFATGAITAGASVLTLTAANELMISSMCNANSSQRVPFTLAGAGPGGIDHSTTCTTFTNAQQATLTDPAGTTVSGAALHIGHDGGSYHISNANAPAVCINCYEETDMFLHTRKYGPFVHSIGGITSPAATIGQGSYSPLNTYNSIVNPAIGTWTDAGGSINFFAGKTVGQQRDFNFCGLIVTASVCDKDARFTVTAAGSLQVFVNELGALTFTPGVLRDYIADTGITSGVAHRFKVNSTTQQGFAINVDGSLLFSCNSASANCGKFTATNTATRTYTFPDATGTVALTTGTTLVYTCGTTSTCSATLQASPHIAQGTVALSGGTATVTAIPAFTSTATFHCTASDNTSITASANAIPASTTSITVTGTGTDTISFVCVGN